MPALSFVLLEAPAPVDPATVVATFAELFPGEPALVHQPAAASGVLDFRSGQLSTFVSTMPVPVPGQEADAAAVRSVSSFRKGGFTVPRHEAHLLVTTMGVETKTVAGLVRHTRVVAAITRASGAVAVYEGNAGATHEPGFYVRAVTGSDLPMMVWNGVSLARTPERVELLSLGMGQLDLPDLLLVAPASQGTVALSFFFDLLAYVARRGARIPEGETVGRDEAEMLAVRYVPSPLDEQAEVARVSMVD
ncbi:MAG: DUF4261 domain-containing protein [Myxococcaceae bacterium]|jgi:hypothetical protein|nr:DUF4261 domain-containing protein [Myxococcaceae bacterium]MCA3014783.1 DUF4261 domain-containing protein [Myxococcaceae bacterium]